MPDLTNTPVFQRILVAVDFSDASKVATQCAINLASRFRAQVKFLHVIDLSLVMMSGEAPATPLLDSMREEGRQGLQQCQTSAGELDCSSELIEGMNVADEVLLDARKFLADVLVVATTSKRGLSKIVFGSKAERIYRESDIAVLVVGPRVPPSPSEPFHCQDILYAGDLLERRIQGLQYVVQIAQKLDACLHLCHVVDSADTDPIPLVDQEVQESIHANLSACVGGRCRVMGSVEYGKTKETLIGLAERMKVGLVILGARNYSFWLTHFENGISTAVIAEVCCPVLVLGSRSIAR